MHTVIEERVERGGGPGGLLDRVRPGWLDVIDLDELNIADGCTCIGAQLCAAKTGTEEDHLFFVRDELGLTQPEEVVYGLDARNPDEYGELNAAWRDLIQRRREMAGVPA